MQRAVAVGRHSTLFAEIAGSVGIDFVYDTGRKHQSLMVESTGGGSGWLDYDADGSWDLYLVQGGDPTRDPGPDQPADRLYRNLGNCRFLDVTSATGIDERRYGQGLAVGDYDNDGFDDLLVTNVGRNVLFHNQGDGTFLEAILASDRPATVWSTSAAWGDIDRDGDLDLYINNYVDYDPKHPKQCYLKNGKRGVCHPKEVEPSPDEFFLNEGDGTFRECARATGLYGDGNRGLGVAIADFNNDGWPDIFVANDTTDNFLFINQQNGTFLEQARLLGCAVNVNGTPQANMGIAVGDYDSNGFLDLYVTHYTKEWNTLYQNLGPNGFHDVTAAAGLVAPTMDKLGFGAIMADFDLNGLQELFVANGHIDDLTAEGIAYQMEPQLFGDQGNGDWSDIGAAAGEIFRKKHLGRSVASCDFDNDGDLDLSMAVQNDQSVLLRNDSTRGHGLKLQFVCQTSNIRGIGTRVTIRSNGRRWIQELAGGTSYCAAHQPVMIFGFGEATGPLDVEIQWPNGQVQTLAGVRMDQSLILREPQTGAR